LQPYHKGKTFNKKTNMHHFCSFQADTACQITPCVKGGGKSFQHTDTAFSAGRIHRLALQFLQGLVQTKWIYEEKGYVPACQGSFSLSSLPFPASVLLIIFSPGK